MRLLNGTTRKTFAAVVLAAVTAGICVLPAQAAGKWVGDEEGPRRATEKEVKPDYPALEDLCRKKGATHWDSTVGVYGGSRGAVAYTAYLRCWR